MRGVPPDAGRQTSRVVQNLVVINLAQVVGNALNFLVIVVIARYLGAERYGRYTYILAVVGALQVLALGGLDQILIREIVVDRANARRLLGAAQAITWPLSLLVVIVTGVVVHLTGAASEIRLGTYVAAVGGAATVHAVCLGAMFRAFERMEVNAAGFVLHKVVFLALAAVVAWTDRGLVGMCAAFALANGLEWAFFLAVLMRHHLQPRMEVNLRLWATLLVECVPLSVGVIVRRLSWQVDTLILGAFGLVQAIGYFNAAYKVIYALQLVPVALAQVLLPVFSRVARSKSGEFAEALAMSVRGALLLALPLTAGLAVCAGPLTVFVYGRAFAPASEALVVMSLALVFVFLNAVYPVVLTALGAQREYSLAAVVGFAVNIVVDVTLIPHLGHVGAAIGILSGEVALFAGADLALRRVGWPVRWMTLTWRPLLAGVGMAAVLRAAIETSGVAFVLGGLASLAAYGALLLALRAVSPRELGLVAEEVRRVVVSRRGIA